MKHVIFSCILLLCLNPARAQLIPYSATDSATYQYYSNKALAECYRKYGDSARAQKMFGRWDGFWNSRVGTGTGTDMFAAYGLALATAYEDLDPMACLGSGWEGAWRPLGPSMDYWGTYSDKAGRVSSLWVSPTDTNYLLAGAAAGGVWKTTDGGKNWANITDNFGYGLMPGTMGVKELVVHPTNNSLIYISAAVGIWTGLIHGIDRYGYGLLYSPDGGSAWYRDLGYREVSGTDGTNGWTNDPIQKMAYTPSGKLLVMTNRHVYMKASATSFWADITPANLTSLPADYTLTDFEFTKLAASGNKVVFATTAKSYTQYLFYYNDAAGTWASRRTLSFPTTTDTITSVTGLGLSKSDSVCLVVHRGEYPYLYKTGLSSGSLLQRFAATFRHFWLDVACSPLHEGLLYTTNEKGTDHFIYKSTDNGFTFSGSGQTHADGRTIEIYSAGSDATGKDDVLFCGTDGGVAKKRKGNDYFISLSGKGLNINTFVALSSNETNNGMMAAGALDNWTPLWIKKKPQPWSFDYRWGSDGMVPAFSRSGDSMAVGQHQTSIYGLKARFSPAGSTYSMLSGVKNPPDNEGEFTKVWTRWIRPLKFDHNNTLRSGFHFIFKSTDYGTIWEPSFDGVASDMNEPKPDVIMDTAQANRMLMGLFKKPVDFYISEQYPNIGYIAYENTINEDTRYEENYGMLYKSTTLTTDKNWDRIDPPSWDLRITGMAVDPVAPNRIWVSMGNIRQWEIDTPALRRKHRVFYSPNGGDTFMDVSKGLPVMPVNSIVYIPGSDDVLFCGTDVGVYRWNKAEAQWECFQQDMPKCIISDLEYLSCSGKLRVSTYGRGIWETPIASDLHAYQPGNVYDITANTTWSQSKTIEGSITVRAGKTLTISGSNTTIFMPLNGRIYVEQGGKLVLDGARITNGCDSSRWAGIVLQGNKALPPTAANQGTFEMKNGAIVENAATGVRDFDLLSYQGGGRILASNSTFLNCWKAVELNDYPGYDRAASCNFSNVTFKVNSQQPIAASTSSLAPHQFTAFNERGIKLTGCSFSDERGLGDGDKRIVAIHVADADFIVENCSFFGLQKGINTTMAYWNPIPPRPTILNSTFDQTRENITIYAHNPLISGNTFTNLRPDALSSPTVRRWAWAVYLEGTQGASVFGNNIAGGPSTVLSTTQNRLKYGIIAKNTGSYFSLFTQSALLLDNRIKNVYAGLQTEQANLGLTFNCNTFSLNTYAVTVNPTTGSLASSSPIIRSQNEGCAALQSRPQNTFNGNGNGIYSWISYTPNYFNYYVNTAASPTYVPTGNWGGVNIISCSGLSSTEANSRCSRNPVYPWTLPALNSALSAFNSAKANDPASEDTWYRYGEVMRGYAQLDDLQGLKSFLLKDNTDQSRTQLLPIYLQEGNYGAMTNTIGALSMSSNEKSAITNYFNILKALKQSGRNLMQLSANEQATLATLANGSSYIANAAKSVLEWGYDTPWWHIPEEAAQARPGAEELTADDESRRSSLGDATPNPVRQSTSIACRIIPYDAANGAYLLVKNLQGKEMARYSLREGDNIVEVATGRWAAGVYLYSLVLKAEPVQTKKFSKVE